MRLTVYGTRGSYPVCRPSVMRYGGNTTCLHLEHAGTHIMIDGGSGAAPLGAHLVNHEPELRNVSIILTHPHWDHVMGPPFFAPLYVPGYGVRVLGADSENKPLESVFATQHRPENFPVKFENLPARVSFQRLHAGTETEVGAFTVRALQLNHPGVNLGYRFEAGGHAFVVLTDLAPAANDNILGAGMRERAPSSEIVAKDYFSALSDFVRGADLVFHDTNFTDEEFAPRPHWGHSTPTHALELLAQHASPPSLMLSHHDPNHDDAMMDAIYEEAKARGKQRRIDVSIAIEGGVWEL